MFTRQGDARTEDRPIADAIVLLGCRIAASGRPAAPAARRAATAARAFFAGVAPRVVASGGRRWGGAIEARSLQLELLRAGVPAPAIVEELLSLSTFENAVFSAALLRKLAPGSAVRPRAAIVTCPWHMPRALASFRSAGVEAVAFPTDTVSMSPLRRATTEVHEVLCRQLDARAMAQATLLHDRAAAFAREIDR